MLHKAVLSWCHSSMYSVTGVACTMQDTLVTTDSASCVVVTLVAMKSMLSSEGVNICQQVKSVKGCDK